jgi:hypothetical protein
MTPDNPLDELWRRYDDIADITDDDLMKIILYERQQRAGGKAAVKDKPESEAPASVREILPTPISGPTIIRRR